MSMEIYYHAKRSTALSAEEEAKIGEITDKYWQEYPRKDVYEGPGTFNGGLEDIIYSGALRIPLEFLDESEEGMQEMEEFLNYWLKWLSDVTRGISGAEWDVEMEDFPLIWEEEGGWRMMSDEEFGERGFE